jgi:hypothetical protein
MDIKCQKGSLAKVMQLPGDEAGETIWHVNVKLKHLDLYQFIKTWFTESHLENINVINLLKTLKEVTELG